MNPAIKIQRAFGSLECNQYFKNIQTGFNKVMQTVNVIELKNGDCLAEITITKDHVSPLNTAHGGFLSTLIDTFTSIALFTHSNCNFAASVTTDLHLTFLKSFPLNKEIQINAKTIKCGKTFAFLECTLTDKDTGEVCVKGNHTKYMIRNQVVNLI